MSRPIISIEGIGKQYAIRGVIDDCGNFSESLRNFLFRKGDKTAKPDVERVWVLRDFNLEVSQGEVLGIIGSNGSGKSTLLKILSRIIRPTVGQAVVRGRVGTLLEVGTGFHPELTGRENIYLSGSFMGMRRAEIRKAYDEIVAFSGVKDFLETPVKRYSSGMYVRLAFSVAAHLRAEIMFIDEVLAVGDMAFQEACMRKMLDLARSGRTILFVSHGLSAVSALCNRTVWLEKGMQKAVGAPQEVIDLYSRHAKSLNARVQAGSRHVWEDEARPSTGGARLLAATLTDETGACADVFDISRPMRLHIAYETTQEITAPVFLMQLQDEQGHIVFQSLSNSPENPIHGHVLPPGQHDIVCEIPGNLLNAGAWRVAFGFQASFLGPLVMADVHLGFRAQDDGALRRDYPGDYPGPLRPALRWRPR